MGAVLARIWRLVRLCLAGPGGKRAGLVFLVVLGLELGAIYISILLVQWSADFFDALEQVDAAAAVRQIGVFAVLISLSASQFLIGEYLRKHVLIRWRETLTDAALDRWYGRGAYWRMRPGFSADGIDNPDQRVAEDCRLFVEGLLREALDLIPAIVGLVSYVLLLWSLSTFPLAFSIFGVEVSIPRYMVWLSFLYVFVSSLVTHGLGRPLKGLYFNQQQREADFRYGLVRTREFATEIAFSQGEVAERRDLSRRFARVRRNWRRLMRRELILGLFTRPYFQSVLRIPMFFALPPYLAGAVTLGGLMQLSQAFSRVTNTLSWFIFSYKELAEFVATAERLDTLMRMTAAPRPMTGAPTGLIRRPADDGWIRTRGVRLTTPTGRPLAATPDVAFPPGTRVWMNGPSGAGKTALLGALGGFWPYGEGSIETPAGRSVYLPQRAYLPASGLAEATVYPADPSALPANAVATTLARVGLDHRITALKNDGPAAVEGLSGGERQRLAIARLLNDRPDWIFLDEATSALDDASETSLLALIVQTLPDAGVIVIAHRPPDALGAYQTWNIQPPPDLEQEPPT